MQLREPQARAELGPRPGAQGSAFAAQGAREAGERGSDEKIDRLANFLRRTGKLRTPRGRERHARSTPSPLIGGHSPDADSLPWPGHPDACGGPSKALSAGALAELIDESCVAA